MEEQNVEVKKPKPLPKLFSINAFNNTAKDKGIGFFDRRKISDQLQAVYDAEFLPGRKTLKETFAARVAELIKLETLTLPFCANAAVKDLHTQCVAILMVMFDAQDEVHLRARIVNYQLRLPFKPNFVRDAPSRAPCRKLLDDLVTWQQTPNPIEQRELLNEIWIESHLKLEDLAGKLKKKVKGEEIGKSKASEPRRLYRHLSFIWSLHHLIVESTTKIVNKRDQETDLKSNVRVFEGKELENYRVLSYEKRFVQLQLEGQGKDACFVVKPFTTVGLIAHQHHYDTGLLVITPDGDIFSGSTVEDNQRRNFVFHSSFAREVFFAGRWGVDNEGILNYLDDYTGHFLCVELNLHNAYQHFADLGIKYCERMMGLIVAQREIPTDAAFEIYCKANEKKVPAALLWATNKAVADLENAANFEACKKQIIEEARKNALWNPAWEERQLVANRNHSFNRAQDHMAADPINPNQFFHVKHKKRNQSHTALDDPHSGVLRTHENEKTLIERQEELRILRKYLTQKDALKDMKITLEIFRKEPAPREIRAGFLYCYPNTDDEDKFKFKFRGSDNVTYEGTQLYSKFSHDTQHINVEKRNTGMRLRAILSGSEDISFNPREAGWVQNVVTELETHESYLLIPVALLAGQFASPSAIMQEAAAKMQISENVYRAFLDERQRFLKIKYIAHPRQQVENLFYGKKCLFMTNKGEINSVFDPEKNHQGVVVSNRYQVKLHSSEVKSLDEKSYVNGLK